MSHLVDEYANKLRARRGVVIYNRVFPVRGEGSARTRLCHQSTTDLLVFDFATSTLF